MNISPDALKLLEKNSGEERLDMGHGRGFLALTPIAQSMKANTNKWDHLKLTSERS